MFSSTQKCSQANNWWEVQLKKAAPGIVMLLYSVTQEKMFSLKVTWKQHPCVESQEVSIWCHSVHKSAHQDLAGSDSAMLYEIWGLL